ncbi:MAG: oligosaccharide flippase family protein [Methylocella sp.]
MGLVGLTAAGQATYLLALPLLARLFSPADFGLFTVYLSVVNISMAFVGLQFESALFSATDRNDARVIVRLVLMTLLVMTLVATALLTFGSSRLAGESGHAIHAMLVFLPFGMFLSGLCECANAWAIRNDSMRTLAIARFLQPFSLAVLQAAFGLMHASAAFLLIAHICSYAVFAAVVFTRTISREDVAGIAGAPLRKILAKARADIKFPLYIMPAVLITLLIGNLPPILIGSLFGADVAGQYGVAYRIIAGPLAVMTKPLGSIFTSEATHSSDPAALRRAVQLVAATSLILVAIPVLILGFFVPYVTTFALGPQWELAGHIAAALSVMGAAQALALPFYSVTSIYRRQEVRLVVDALRLCLVFPPLILGAYAGWDAFSTVRLMATGGTAGYLLDLAVSFLILKAASRRMEAGSRRP